jgi:hypothetical protein
MAPPAVVVARRRSRSAASRGRREREDHRRYAEDEIEHFLDVLVDRAAAEAEPEEEQARHGSMLEHEARHA